MKTVSVKELNIGGISRSVKDAEVEPLLVSRNNEPAAFMVSASEVAKVANRLSGDPSLFHDVLALMAVDLFDRGVLSIGKASSLLGIPLSEFIELCNRLDVPILRESDEGIEAEVDAFASWLQSTRTTEPPINPAP
jgi:predicted HTH domain antitoxin